MSKWDKNSIVQVFSISEEENINCIILVTTNVYGMDINNPDIQLIIQWDISLFSDSMIQQIGGTKKKVEYPYSYCSFLSEQKL